VPNDSRNDQLRIIFLQTEDLASEEKAPSRLKARVYSALIREQQTTGPLQDLSATQAAGHSLCVFEQLVQIAPVGEAVKTPFFCWACHARALAERIENAPIYWPHCPYAEFQNRRKT